MVELCFGGGVFGQRIFWLYVVSQNKLFTRPVVVYVIIAIVQCASPCPWFLNNRGQKLLRTLATASHHTREHSSQLRTELPQRIFNMREMPGILRTRWNSDSRRVCRRDGDRMVRTDRHVPESCGISGGGGQSTSLNTPAEPSAKGSVCMI